MPQTQGNSLANFANSFFYIKSNQPTEILQQQKSIVGAQLKILAAMFLPFMWKPHRVQWLHKHCIKQDEKCNLAFKVSGMNFVHKITETNWQTPKLSTWKTSFELVQSVS